MCRLAAGLGWEVDVITSWKDPKTLADFPGAEKVLAPHPDSFEFSSLDAHSAVMLMTHNFSLDLKYLLKLQKEPPTYLGVIGSRSRRDRLHEALLQRAPHTGLEFLESIHSPAGLDIGAITPEEIALSVLAEILAVFRQKQQTLSNRHSSAGM